MRSGQPHGGGRACGGVGSPFHGAGSREAGGLDRAGGSRADGHWPPVPRLWPGETVVIAASGPSQNEADLQHVQGKARLIVVNRTYELAPWADLLYACDFQWWGENPKAAEFAGLKVTATARELAKRPWLKRVPYEEGAGSSAEVPGLSLDPTRIHTGGNSGYQALNLAVLLGASRILLTGYDMGAGSALHWHEDHRRPLSNPPKSSFPHWRRRFGTTLPDLRRAGVEVINCSRETALECFPRARLEDVI